MDTLYLYFIAFTNEYGINLDWFVLANDFQEALALWKAEPMVASYRENYLDEPMIWRLPTIVSLGWCVDGPRCLDWDKDLTSGTPIL